MSLISFAAIQRDKKKPHDHWDHGSYMPVSEISVLGTVPCSDLFLPRSSLICFLASILWSAQPHHALFITMAEPSGMVDKTHPASFKMLFQTFVQQYRGRQLTPQLCMTFTTSVFPSFLDKSWVECKRAWRRWEREREAPGIVRMDASEGGYTNSLKSFLNSSHSPFSLLITQWQPLVINMYSTCLYAFSPVGSLGPQSSFPMIENVWWSLGSSWTNINSESNVKWLEGFSVLAWVALFDFTESLLLNPQPTRLCTEHALMHLWG